MAENSTPTPKSSEQDDAVTEDVVAGGHQMESEQDQKAFAVTKDYAAEIDELAELERKLDPKQALPQLDKNAWREGYPYERKLDRKSYEKRKRAL